MPTVSLPVLHAGQIAAYRMPAKRKAIRCGRRWGKTTYGETIACDGAVKGWPIGYFTPGYKYLAEVFNDSVNILAPVKRSSSKVEGVIHTTTGGRIDFWTLEDERAGRSRKYKHVIIDEAAFTKPNMMEIWERSIEPTLLDYNGSVTVLSNTNGVLPTNFFWQICNVEKFGFKEYHAPTSQNPLVPLRMPNEDDDAYAARRVETFEQIQRSRPPLVYQQEYLAQFVDWSGVAFFARANLLHEGRGVPYPRICDSVLAVIDSAVKDGKEHDGTGVSYWAYSRHQGFSLICLDWEYVQILGGLLVDWVPSVVARCKQLARECGARLGSAGIFIEDASSGALLLQQCEAREIVAHALPSELTALGKDGRAINASAPVYQNKVKFSEVAFNRVSEFKEQELNHMWSQVTGFRIGDKDADKRADDLLDTFTYAVAITCGDDMGIG